ncbi:hypothetical protein DA717_13605 [Piscirickettsiaceae bacterium NZ-RLO2]|uniref:hypothetical protein n=1 Tax=Piscirickettsia salmonis TaxID=1238 RepID=UPI000F088F63|nr:hypothetical protein DA717_13605 [Piscirickettsiaceae bacterium NZ-RLO2]
MNSDRLLAIGAALVKAVRKSIKYSENLYSPKGVESFYDDRSSKIDSIRENINLFSGKVEGVDPATYAKQALDKRIGVCSEVSKVATYLASMLNQLEMEESVYISVIGPPHHTFCLIHQSYALHQQTTVGVCIADSLEELSENKELENAVIVDPWLYKASNLINYKSHIGYAQKFIGDSAIEYFNDKIYTEGYSEKLSTTQPTTIVEKRLLRDFNIAYQEETQKLLAQSEAFAQGRNRSSIDNNLIRDARRWNQIKDLQLFIERLASKSSHWYSCVGYKNRKNKSYQALIGCLDFAVDKYMDISNTDLQEILNQALQLAPVMGSMSSLKTLCGHKIYMTKTAKGLLDLDVVPRECYRFESIPGMSLSGIRNIRYFPGSEAEKYTALLQFIKQENMPPHSYNAINNLVNRSQGESSLTFYNRAAQEFSMSTESSVTTLKYI